MPLVKIRPKSINMDLPPEVVGPEEWTFAQNCVMDNDRTLSALGAVPVWGIPQTRPIWGASVPRVPARAIYAGSLSLHATDGVNHSNITPAAGFGGTDQAFFTGGMLNGLAIVNDSQRPPAYWDGALANIALPLPGWPGADRARSLRPFKYFLVQAGGIINGTDAPFGVRWSVSAAPGQPPSSWTPSSTNDAGYVTLAGAREPLVDCAPIRDGLMVFEPHATWIMGYVGGAYTFTLRRLFHSIGLLAPNAFAMVGAELLVVTDGDVIMTDGSMTRSILSRRMQRAMFSAISGAARSRVFCAHSIVRGEVLIAYPQGLSTYCDKGLVYNYRSNTIGLVDLPDYSFAFPSYQMQTVSDAWDSAIGSWDSELRAWDYGGFESDSGFIVAQRPPPGSFGLNEAVARAETPADGPVEVIARKEHMSIEGSGGMFQLTRIYPKMEGPDGTEVFWRVGVAAAPGHPTAWGPEQRYILGTDHKVDVRLTGRYAGVQVRSLTLRAWSCSGFDLEFQPAGAR